MTNLSKASASQSPNKSLPQISSLLRWTRSSYYMFSGFILLLTLIGYVWWPLVEEYISYFNPNYPVWQQIDWLLIGNFLFMSLMIMARADIKADIPIIVIGLFGGLAIEGWGTQTELWSYYTNERPPLWIIPAWPIASLSIDRLYRMIRLAASRVPDKVFTILYWSIFPSFYTLMLIFVRPTLDKSFTVLALILSALLILTTSQHRAMTLTFLAGAGLGYFLELWGTTRLCWTYYTHQTPPFFAVLAHGMAAVAFWRTLKLYQVFTPKLRDWAASLKMHKLFSKVNDRNKL